jgi:hypothetical protein
MFEGRWFAWYPVRADRRWSRHSRGRWVWLRWVWRIDCQVPAGGSVQLDGFYGESSIFHPRTARIYITLLDFYDLKND